MAASSSIGCSPADPSCVCKDPRFLEELRDYAKERCGVSASNGPPSPFSPLSRGQPLTRPIAAFHYTSSTCSTIDINTPSSAAESAAQQRSSGPVPFLSGWSTASLGPLALAESFQATLTRILDLGFWRGLCGSLAVLWMLLGAAVGTVLSIGLYVRQRGGGPAAAGHGEGALGRAEEADVWVYGGGGDGICTREECESGEGGRSWREEGEVGGSGDGWREGWKKAGFGGP